jgi:uncharacterized protein
MKLLIFSDTHGDTAALAQLMQTEADLYFAAGDLVNWGRGLERAGPILARRADRTYVLPGNHESENDIARLCTAFQLHNFHGSTVEINGYNIAGLGYSNPTPFDTPGEYSEAELAERLSPFAGLNSADSDLPLPPERHAARPRAPERPCRQHGRADVYRNISAGLLFLWPHP